ncbi:MAG: MOSC domain-containing protein [Anaerolineales bacterium]|nr:MOSC domain-containing protein [Anaerolineales bacterium]
MHLLSINIGKRQEINTTKSRQQTTGIFKIPASGPVTVGELGLEGDLIANGKYHGGPDQAVYLYGQADYDFWADELGELIAPGLFGENLTISGLESGSFNVGDFLTIGEVRLQVTAPRIPCDKFAARIGDPHFIKKFRDAERPGLYCRVLQTGQIRAGDMVSVERYTGETVSIVEMYCDHYAPDNSESALRRFLAAPIDIRSRVKFEERLGEDRD